MNTYIKSDLHRFQSGPYSFWKLLQGFRSQGFRYMFFLRKCADASNPLTFLFYKLWLRRYSFKYGFQISPSTKIGYGLYLGHFGTIIISVNAVIGNNCNIGPGVTIGRDHRGKRKGAPTIGNQVWIGTNSVIVGNVSIGDNVLIAPNSFVNNDIPPNSIAIGNPVKIIERSDATEGYINNQYHGLDQ